MLLGLIAAAATGLGPVKLIYCHMLECSWSRLVSNELVSARPNEQLRKYVALGGSSVHRDGNYPVRYSKRVHIEWEHKPAATYVLCSRRRPSIAFQDRWDPKSKGRWYAHYLDLFSLAGYNTSSAVIYMDACHHIDFNSRDPEKALKKLGYRPGTRSEQVDLRGPTDLLKP
jgi:hypothetical protein